MRVKDKEGTKKRKIYYMSYWTTFCAAYDITGFSFGKELRSNAQERKYKVKEELAVLSTFAGYVVMYPRHKSKKAQQCSARGAGGRGNT